MATVSNRKVKDKILEAVQGMFMKYGVRSVSMDDIARQLSMSKKTLYQHVKDKDELVLRVTESHLDGQRDIYSTISKNAANAIDELALISVWLRNEMEGLNPSLLFDIEKYHPKAWEVWRQFKASFVRESIIKNLKAGIRDGYFRSDLKPEILATMRILCIEAGCNGQFFSQEAYPLTEIHKQLFDHFVLGVCTDKGRRLYIKQQKNISLEYENLFT